MERVSFVVEGIAVTVLLFLLCVWIINSVPIGRCYLEQLSASKKEAIDLLSKTVLLFLVMLSAHL